MIEVHVGDTDGAIEFGRAEHADIVGDAKRIEYEAWLATHPYARAAAQTGIPSDYPGVGQGFIDEEAHK